MYTFPSTWRATNGPRRGARVPKRQMRLGATGCIRVCRSMWHATGGLTRGSSAPKLYIYICMYVYMYIYIYWSAYRQ